MPRDPWELRHGEVWVDCEASDAACEEATRAYGREVHEALDDKSFGPGHLSRMRGRVGTRRQKYARLQLSSVNNFAASCRIPIHKLVVDKTTVREWMLANQQGQTDEDSKVVLAETLAVHEAPSNSLFKYAMIGTGISGVGVLGLARELGFSRSVHFESIPHLSVLDLTKSGITWIPLIPILVSLPVLWLLSKRRAIGAPWALIVGGLLFALLSQSATELISLRDLDVYAVALVGFLTCLAIILHARAKRLSHGLVLGAVAVSALSAAWLDGVAEGSHAKSSPDLYDVLLKGEKIPMPISLLRNYKDGLLVVMPTKTVGGRLRDEVTFLPSWRVCTLSTEFHLDLGQTVCS